MKIVKPGNAIRAYLSVCKKWMYFALLPLLLSSCLGPKKIDKWVSMHYGGALPAAPKNTNDFLTIKSALQPVNDKLSNTKKKTSRLLPLIFYWSYNYKNTCVLNERIPLNNFTKTAMTYATQKKLKQKLNGSRLEIDVENLPNTFSINDKGHIVWVVYAFAWDILTIFPENNKMKVSYKVVNGNATIKSGEISIPGPEKPVALKMMQSLRKRTWQYLDEYELLLSAMSKQVMEKIAGEL